MTTTPENIIIGKPLISLKKLDITDDEITVYEKEYFLPKLLKKYGFFPSTTQVRKNRPDLWKELSGPEILDLKIGKRRLYIVVGEKDGVYNGI